MAGAPAHAALHRYSYHFRLVDTVAGYLEDWKFTATLSGTPQGGVVSPILSNIYLDRLDKWIESTLLPTYTRETERKYNTAYTRANARVQKLRRIGQRKEAMALRKQIRTLPTHDPDYRRLRLRAVCRRLPARLRRATL